MNKQLHLLFFILLLFLCIPVTVYHAQSNQQAKASVAGSWIPFTKSMNVSGVVFSNSKPLQYNDELNVISFIHQKSPTYLASPVPNNSASSNVIVGMISVNWGTTWDSTCLWNHDVVLANYPQGAIYNPPGNASISNAYLVANGTSKNNLGATGNWFTSKQMGITNYNNVSNVLASSFISNGPPYSAISKVDFAHYDFTSTDDGLVRAIGGIFNNANASAKGYRGARILTGTFSNGFFNWVGDSIIPPFIKHSVTLESMADTMAHMAWNDAGTIGYLWFIGCRQGAINANKGYQPIVYKTTNQGNTWTLLPAIDFNTTGFKAPVLNRLEPVAGNSTLVIPAFNSTEGIDGTIDGHGELHLVATIKSTSKSHPDSLNNYHHFTNFDGEKYSYRHQPGYRPYIYDFTTSGLTWKVTIVDSMSSEAPGTKTNEPGYADNPWNPGLLNIKPTSGARIQLSRTPDGNSVVYTWAESDTNITNSNHKWNHLPNVKVRKLNVNTNQIASVKFDVTNPMQGANPFVGSRATMHYVSPKCNLTYGNSGPCMVKLPITVSNNDQVPLDPFFPITHWYSTQTLPFDQNFFVPNCGVGLKENGIASGDIFLYPNPFNDKISVNVINKKGLQYSISNLLGNEVMSGQLSEFETIINTGNLKPGVYLISIYSNNRKVMVRKMIKT